jgi:hypothetical protein
MCLAASPLPAPTPQDVIDQYCNQILCGANADPRAQEAILDEARVIITYFTDVLEASEHFRANIDNMHDGDRIFTNNELEDIRQNIITVYNECATAWGFATYAS